MAINFGSQVRTLQLKFYVEQLMPAIDRKKYTELWKIKDKNQKALEYCKEMENYYCTKFWNFVQNFQYKNYYVAAIYHNKDMQENEGSPFEVSSKKGHWHVMIWRGSWKAPKERFRVSTIVKKLGLAYAPDLDSSIWKKHGAEVITQGVPAFFTYLPHETDQAIKDGKAIYDHKEIAKNFSDVIANEIFEFYKKTKKKSSVDWDLLGEQAYQLGLALGDYDAWIDTQLNLKQEAQAVARKVHERYMQGLAVGVETKGHITRCSIILYGDGNSGKSYTTIKALEEMHLKTYSVRSGTGKYDGLSATDQAMLFDDIGVSQALSVFDNKAVVLHRRNSGDRPWVGTYAVVTTNADPEEALAHMLGVSADPVLRSPTDERLLDALKSRVYICRIEKGELFLEKAQHRGSQKDFDEHDKLFIKFKNAFDHQLKTYKKDCEPVSKLELFFEKYGK